MGRRRGDPQRNFLEHDDVRDLRTGALALLYGASYSHIDVADAFPAGTGKKVVLITGANGGIGGEIGRQVGYEQELVRAGVLPGPSPGEGGRRSISGGRRPGGAGGSCRYRWTFMIMNP